MTAISDDACDQAIHEARSQARAAEDEIVRRESFDCAQHPGTITPAQCVECWEKKSYSDHYRSRQKCIAANRIRYPERKPQMKKEIAKADKGLKPLVPQPLAAVGETVEVVIEKGQTPVHVQITPEMIADREAALAYAAESARFKLDASLKLAVAVALYAGEGAYAPWSIDGYDSFRQAVKETFGLKERSAHYYSSIGRTLIAQYGKDKVIEQAREMGVAQIPYHKLRELLKAPRQFERLLNTGRIHLPSGETITIDDVVNTRVDQLPLLFERFTEPAALPAKSPSAAPIKKWEETDPFAGTTAGKTEAAVLASMARVQVQMQIMLADMARETTTWPANAGAVIKASGTLNEKFDEVSSLLSVIVNTLAAMEEEPAEAVKVSTEDGYPLTMMREAFRETLKNRPKK